MFLKLVFLFLLLYYSLYLIMKLETLLLLILSAVILIVSASQISVSSVFKDEITIEAILNNFFDVFAFIVIGIVGIVYSVKKIFQQF